MNQQVKLNNNLVYLNNAIDIFVDAIVGQKELPTIEYIYGSNP